MKRITISLFSLFVLSLFNFAQGAVKPVNITFKAHDTSLQQVEIQFAETDTIIPLTLVGDTTTATKTMEGRVTLNIPEATYGRITYRWKKSTVYLEPGKDFNMEWDLTPAALTVSVNSKKSQINPYLSGNELHGPVMGDFGKDPSEILDLMEEYCKNCFAVLDSKKLDKTFVAKERQRITYWIYGFLAQYAQQKQCDEAVYEMLQALSDVYDGWLVQMPEYTNYQYSAVTALALRDADIDETPEGQAKAVTTVLEYVVKNVKNNDLLQYLIGTNAVALVANNGTEGAERIKEIVDANITDKTILHAFNVAWAEGNKLKAGRPSPDFNFEDIDGKHWTLADLRGKYVYIDIWATWCVPCKGEIPHLKKLEETFHGMNIAFVSLSCDRDKAKWSNMVKEQNLTGIQLWGGEDNDFLRKYRAQTIPRFIFLDPNGRIINPDMTRPSDPKTMEALGMIAMPME